jgi:acyl-CoA thioesterase-1
MNGARFKLLLATFLLPLLLLAAAPAKPPAQMPAHTPVKLLAFGTRLTEGYGLPPGTEFTAVLARRLKQAGIAAAIVNAGVSGDTSSDGLSRLDWSLADHPDAVILELGSNDALRGIDPAVTEQNLTAILAKLKAAHVPTLLIGMKAPRNLGADYANAFDPIYPKLAARFGVLLYPFMLDGVALNPKLKQADGIHPNPAGVTIIVDRMFPYVEKLVAEAKH